MDIQKFITKVAGSVPPFAKLALRGRHLAPRRFANVIHQLLNNLPVDRYPVLSCSGRLKGCRMRIDWRIHRAFVYDTWEPEVTNAIDQRVRTGMTVVDIGAQSGFYTILLSRLVGSEGKVIAFEPLPANYRLLEENLRLNRIENVLVRREAVADHSGTLNFHFPVEEPSLVAGPILAEDKTGDFDVDCVSLDDFVSKRHVRLDLIKMDVEGAETSVIEGALRTIQEFHPVLIVELHNFDASPRQHPVASRLQALGYAIEWLDERSVTSHILATWMAT